MERAAAKGAEDDYPMTNFLLPILTPLAGVLLGYFVVYVWYPTTESHQVAELERTNRIAAREAHHAAHNALRHTSARFAGKSLSTAAVMRFMADNDYASPASAWPSAWGIGGVLEVTPGRAEDELHLHFGAYPDQESCQRAAASVTRAHRTSLAATPTCSAEAPYVLEAPLHFASGGTDLSSDDAPSECSTLQRIRRQIC